MWGNGLLGKDCVDSGLGGVLGVVSGVWVAGVFAAVSFEFFGGLSSDPLWLATLLSKQKWGGRLCQRSLSHFEDMRAGFV